MKYHFDFLRDISAVRISTLKTKHTYSIRYLLEIELAYRSGNEKLLHKHKSIKEYRKEAKAFFKEHPEYLI